MSIKRDGTVELNPGVRGFFRKHEYWKITSRCFRYIVEIEVNEELARIIQAGSYSEPTPIGWTGWSHLVPGWKWWIYKNRFYTECDLLPDVQMKPRIISKYNKECILESAPQNTTEGSLSSMRREQIPDEVKIYVWRRDEGKCAKCGSRVKLEYDHIIPVALGGSNTERNIQLLCESCNRKKGKNIV